MLRIRRSPPREQFAGLLAQQLRQRILDPVLTCKPNNPIFTYGGGFLSAEHVGLDNLISAASAASFKSPSYTEFGYSPQPRHPAPKKPRLGSRPHLMLDPEFGIDEASWGEFLRELYARHLRRPLNRTETLTFTGTMWVLVEPPESGDAGPALRMGSAINLLRRTADFPVRERLLRGGEGELRKFASEITEQDLAVFLKGWRRNSPGIRFALAFTVFGAFDASLILFDMFPGRRQTSSWTRSIARLAEPLRFPVRSVGV